MDVGRWTMEMIMGGMGVDGIEGGQRTSNWPKRKKIRSSRVADAGEQGTGQCANPKSAGDVQGSNGWGWLSTIIKIQDTSQI